MAMAVIVARAALFFSPSTLLLSFFFSFFPLLLVLCLLLLGAWRAALTLRFDRCAGDLLMLSAVLMAKLSAFFLFYHLAGP